MIQATGIDVSTFAIDFVKVPLDPDVHALPEWTSYTLHGTNAVERAAFAPSMIPRGSFWDDVAEVAIERPYGPGGDTLFALHLVVGVVLSALPDRLRPPLYLHPSQWRKQAGMSGRATKSEVSICAHRYMLDNARAIGLDEIPLWPQDACDAYCIALAARNMNLERLERAA